MTVQIFLVLLLLCKNSVNQEHKGGSGYENKFHDNATNNHHQTTKTGHRGPLLGASDFCMGPEGRIGTCQIHVHCSTFFMEYILSNDLKRLACKLPDGRNGVCCADEKKESKDVVKAVTQIKEQSNPFDETLQLSMKSSLMKLAEGSEDDARDQERLDLDLSSKGAFCQKGTSSYGHLLFFMTTSAAMRQANLARSLLKCSSRLKNQHSLTKEDAMKGLHAFSMQGTKLSSECPVPPLCPLVTFYRRPDGSCNNQRDSSLGTSFTPLKRLLLPDYEDGLWKPRVSQSGSPLPSARLLSATITRDESHPHTFLTLWVMQFGQFIDHDLTHVPVFRLSTGQGIECCTNGGREFQPEERTHPLCLPISIPQDDNFHRAFRNRCMNFVRSMIASRSDCSLGYADQMNQVTHWLDSSNIYGSSLESERSLRNNEPDGLLDFAVLPRFRQGGYPSEILPRARAPLGDECTDPRTGRFCFHAGDLRSNEMIGLTATHTIWLREHNRVARKLKNLNPTFTRDQIFHEARRIVNAQYQHIIYNEWLPIVIGKQYMDTYGITPMSSGYFNRYDEDIDPRISNEFSAAAFRMGHTLIQGLIQLVQEIGFERSDDVIIIHEHFNEAFDIEQNGRLDRILKSLARQTIQSYDSFITSEVTNRLFQPRNGTFGMDLVALNLQRARDHGLPGYNHYRDLCQVGKGKVASFDEFGEEISPNIVSKLKRLYKNVDDVDLFIGGITENPYPGSLLGPTFTCLIADQFVRLRKGDRFTYDIGGQSHSFTEDQLQEIRKASFARILCDNGDRIGHMQPLAFYRAHPDINPSVSCDSPLIPHVNLEFWK